MTNIKVKALINQVRDGKLIKIGETFEIDESEIERMLRHEAVEIIEGPVETENKEVYTNPLNDEKLDGENSGEGSNLGAENPDGGVNPLDEENSGDDLGDGTITLEEIQDMTVPQIKKLAEDNDIELHGKLKDELAQELFDKLGEE